MLGACADVTQQGDDRSFVDENGRYWQDLGPLVETTESLFSGEFQEEDNDTSALGELAGVYREGDDGHEYFSEALDPVTTEILAAAYEQASGLEPEVQVVDGPRHVEAERVIGSDGRSLVTGNGGPIAAIGHYQITFAAGTPRCGWNNSDGCSSRCTATVIAHDASGAGYAATAAHCMYDNAQNAWIRGNDANPAFGNARGRVCFNSGRCYRVVDRRFSSTWRNAASFAPRHDYALLKLSPVAIGGSLNSLTTTEIRLSGIQSSWAAEAIQARNHGYTRPPRLTAQWWANAGTGLWGMVGCRVTQARSRHINHNCDTSGGHSGGPVYYRAGDGSFRLMAIHSGSSVFTNMGARVSGRNNPTFWWLATTMQ